MVGPLNKTADWGGKWGLKIFIGKTKYVIFSNKKAECQGLFVYVQAIERVKRKKDCFIFKMSKEVEKLELGEVGVAPLMCWSIIPL